MRIGAAYAFVLLCAATAYADEIVVVSMPLWPGTPPGSEGVEIKPEYEGRENTGRPNRWLTGVTHPELTVYRPSAELATGAAVIVLPGGGYHGLAIDKEGHYVARWLAERGVVGVVLPYRCGGGPFVHPMPMNDAQRALQTVRSRAAEWGVDPERVGVMGFSAGGHLAATTATQWLDADPSAEDSVRRVSSRPDFAVLVYPVVSLRPEVTHRGSLRNLFGDSPTDGQIAELSADERVTTSTPPTLLIHAVDDQAVPVENPQRFYEACRKHGVPVEMHLYEAGGHGYGMWATEGSVSGWPAVLEGWLKALLGP